MAVLCLLANTPWPWPTPAGAASARGGVPHPWNGAISAVEGAERSGGLHKRSTEDWGASCRAPGTESLSRLESLHQRKAQRLLLLGSGFLLGVGVAGRERPQICVVEDGKA